MKRILCLIICLTLATICYATTDTLEGEELTTSANIEGVTTTDTVEGQEITSGAVSCNSGTDYVGDKTTGRSSDYTTAEDRIYLIEYTAVCASGCSSGVLGTAYIEHALIGLDNVKVCVWAEDGDNTPDSGDILVGCSSVISGEVANTTYNDGGDIAGSITCGNDYWVGSITDSTGWGLKGDASGDTMYYKDDAGSYASPPDPLPDSWSSIARPIEWYVTIAATP